MKNKEEIEQRRLKRRKYLIDSLCEFQEKNKEKFEGDQYNEDVGEYREMYKLAMNEKRDFTEKEKFIMNIFTRCYGLISIIV